MPASAQLSSIMVKTFWRSQLYSHLRERKILRKIILHKNVLHFETDSWDEYWKDVPLHYRSHVLALKRAWENYFEGGFRSEYKRKYCAGYLDLLDYTVRNVDSENLKEISFLGSVLGFENAILAESDSSCPFAAMTSCFRNPVFLSFQCGGIRSSERNFPSLLPLVVAKDDKPYLFYHYRKQKLIHNTDENLMFFPAVDIETRKDSFRGFDKLIQIFVEPWDSRVDQRSRMIVDKVFPSVIKEPDKRSIRILDIGSGDGVFTSNVIGRMRKKGLIGKAKVELSMLDILVSEPDKSFGSKEVMASMSKLEYISMDFAQWLKGLDHNYYYDIVFLFRILHNVSSFKIFSEQISMSERNIFRGRYRVFSHLSRYYQAISVLFDELTDPMVQKKDGPEIFYPARIFQHSCLLFDDQTSIIEKMCRISSGILIEDSDLTSEILVDHISKYLHDNIYVYDFSSRLHLSVNHIFWVTGDKRFSDLPGERIWPKSGK